MNKKLIVLILSALLVVSLYGCGNSTAKKAIEEGKIAIASGEYDKALNLFKLAVDEDGGDEAKTDYNAIDSYLKSKSLLEEGKIDEAKKLLDGISKIDSFDKFNKDVDVLRSSIKNKEELNEKIDNIDTLIKDKKYKEAKDKLEKINKKDLSNKDQKFIDNKLNQIESIITEEKKKEIEEKEKQIISNGVTILKKAGINNVKYVGKKKEPIKIEGFKGIIYCYQENTDLSPEEYYYNPTSNEMCLLNQGAYLIVNNNYKNVTPKSSADWENSEKFRNSILANKIKFTKEDAKKIIEKKYGDELIGPTVIGDGNGNEYVVINGVKIYMYQAETKTTNRSVVYFGVGSDGKLYDYYSLMEGKLKERKC